MPRPMLARLRKLVDPPPDASRRPSARMVRASDVILVMMAGLLVGLAVFRFLHG